MFSPKNEFSIPVPTRDDPSGELRCLVRFPTDQEWCTRARKIRPKRKLLGRGKSIDIPARAELVEAELLAKIRLDPDGPKFDPFDAEYIIDILSECSVVEATRNGAEFLIVLKVPGGIVTHVLKMPYQRELTEFRRATFSVIDGPQVEETTFALEPSGELWDKLRVSVEGYAGDIPIIHKYGAILGMLRLRDAGREDQNPEV